MVTTQQLTASDLWQLRDEGEDYELIEGALAPMVPPGGEHGIVQLRIGSLLLSHADTHQSGRMFGESVSS